MIYTDAVPNDLQGSLLLMREQMLSRPDLVGAVFIGGMDGVEVEYDIFKQFNQGAFILPVAAPGGAALNLARDKGYFTESELDDIDFASLFNRFLPAH